MLISMVLAQTVLSTERMPGMSHGAQRADSGRCQRGLPGTLLIGDHLLHFMPGRPGFQCSSIICPSRPLYVGLWTVSSWRSPKPLKNYAALYTYLELSESHV